MKKVRAKYIRVSEETNALDYLEKAHLFIEQVDKHPSDWKWIIISLFGSLYGFAICALQGTNYENVTYTNSKGERRLITFEEAIKRCQSKDRMTWTVFSKELILTPEQDRAIQKLLREFRNDFEHYVPRSWSIEIHGFPDMAINVLHVIKFLALYSGNYVRLSKSQQRKVSSIVFRSTNMLKKSRIYKESVLASTKSK